MFPVRAANRAILPVLWRDPDLACEMTPSITRAPSGFAGGIARDPAENIDSP